MNDESMKRPGSASTNASASASSSAAWSRTGRESVNTGERVPTVEEDHLPRSPMSASLAAPPRALHPASPHFGALDGLRGVAVAVVVGFHLWPGRVPGGWLGVSLFFTLSGFLIIGQVDRRLATGRFDALDFYRRRARRLLPALSLTLVGVMIAVWTAHPEAFDRVRTDVLAALGFAANWRQAAEPGGYEAIFDVIPRPLAHLWSLAIEEQVYLIVPALLVLTRRPIATVLCLGAAGAAGLWFWWGDPDLYYATPVRALEVLAGAGVALWFNRAPGRGLNISSSRARPCSRQHVGQVAGLVAMGVLVASVPDVDAIRRPWLLPAIALLVWCPLLVAALGGGGPLELSPLRWLGERSYAIYLFHWPLVVLTTWPPLMVVAVTLLLADASYRLIEMPIRRGVVIRRAPLVRLVGATAAIGMIAVVAPLPTGVVAPVSAAEALAVARDVSAPPAPVHIAEGPTAADLVSFQPADVPIPAAVAPAPAPTLLFAAGAALAPAAAMPPITPPRSVLLAGDSTAMRIEEPLRLWAEENGIVLTIRAVPACSPVARSWEVRLGFVDWPLMERNDCSPNPEDLAVDAVVLIHHGVLAFQHRLPGEDWIWLTSSQALRDDVIAAYTALADSTDARLLIASVPDIDLDEPTVDDLAAPVATDLISSLAASRPDIVMLDSSVVSSDAARYARSDGIHLDALGAAAFVLDVIVPALLGPSG